MARGRLRL